MTAFFIGKVSFSSKYNVISKLCLEKWTNFKKCSNIISAVKSNLVGIGLSCNISRNSFSLKKGCGFVTPEELKQSLQNGNIDPLNVQKEITKDFCKVESNVYAVMRFFDERLDLESMKDGWRRGDKAIEIADILQRNTLSQGHGISKLRAIDALEEVLPGETLRVISALEEVVSTVFQFRGADDCEFWKRLINKHRKMKIKEVLMVAVFKCDFSDEQLSQVVSRGKFVGYVPEDRQNRIAQMLKGR